MDLPHRFHSQRKLALLNDIDKLRSYGVSKFVNLPQLIVCGDQSSGKSSVLEAVSGIPFPSKDNLCTRFATEVILRHSSETSLYVEVCDDVDGPAEAATGSEAFQYSLSGVDDFPSMVEAAHEYMNRKRGPQSFYKDVLRLKVSGPDQPHLTIVDLPGLIHSESKNQSEADIEVVKSMVSEYMRQARSVILAVVSAKNDSGNQIVLRLARKFDPKGERTMGVITKPDELRRDSGSETSYLEMAQNQDVYFNLGWHVLRNRDYNERDSTKSERDENERRFFATGRWRQLSPGILGIDALRPRLSDILFEQIERQLQDLISDIQTEIRLCEDTLVRLGPSRAKASEQRRFLFHISQDFQRIVKTASDGFYDHAFFGSPLSTSGTLRRLRAVVQNANLEFSKSMNTKGQDRLILEDDDTAEYDIAVIHRSEFIKEIERVLQRTRGKELPGMFNPLVVGDIFHQQSKPWKELAENHSLKVWKSTRDCLEAVVSDLAYEPTSEALLSHIIDKDLERRRKQMLNKLNEILEPYLVGSPITYNHHFIETIQTMREARKRQEALNHLLGGKLPSRGDTAKIEANLLRTIFSSSNGGEIDHFAGAEILDCMESFYQVALKAVVDNVAIYVVEQSLLHKLENVFCPTVVDGLSEDMLHLICAEPAQNQRSREQVTQKLNILREGLTTVQVHSLQRRQIDRGDNDQHAPSTSSDDENKFSRSSTPSDVEKGLSSESSAKQKSKSNIWTENSKDHESEEAVPPAIIAYEEFVPEAEPEGQQVEAFGSGWKSFDIKDDDSTSFSRLSMKKKKKKALNG